MAEDIILAANAADAYEWAETVRKTHRQPRQLRTFDAAAGRLLATRVEIKRILLAPGWDRKRASGREMLRTLLGDKPLTETVFRIGPYGEILNSIGNEVDE